MPPGGSFTDAMNLPEAGATPAVAPAAPEPVKPPPGEPAKAKAKEPVRTSAALPARAKEAEGAAPPPLEAGAGGEAGAAAASDKAKPATPARLYKVKVDGVESEIAENELIKGYQLARSSQKRHMEAAKLEKASKDILASIPGDPKATFVAIFAQQLGSKEAAEERWLKLCQEEFVKVWENDQLPEGERDALRLREENERLKKETADFKRSEEEKLRVQEENRVGQLRMRELALVMKDQGIEVTEKSLDGVIDIMIYLREAGYDPTPEQALEFYRDDLEADPKDELRTKTQWHEEFKALPLEEKLKLYPELAGQVTEANLTAVRAKRSAPPGQAVGEPLDGGTEQRLVKRKPVSVFRFLD